MNNTTSSEYQFDLDVLGADTDDHDFQIDLYADERHPESNLRNALSAFQQQQLAPEAVIEDAPITLKRTLAKVEHMSDTPTDLVIVDDENSNVRLAHISEDVTSLAIDLGVDISLPVKDMIHDAGRDMANAATLLVRSGVKLIAAKAQCQHGEFEPLCEAIGISRFRAAEAMRYASFASRLPSKERDKYLVLPKKSALLLANAEPEVISFLLEDENLELTRKVRNRAELTELARALTESEDERKRYQSENEALHKEMKALRQAQEAQIAGSEYPAVVVQLRKESSVLADEAIAALSSIRTHVESFEYFAGDVDTAERNLHAALFPALNNVASVFKAADDLIRDICNQFGLNPLDIAGRSNSTLPTEELAIIEAARDTMLARKAGKAAARQSQYADNGDLTRGRGRPRKA